MITGLLEDEKWKGEGLFEKLDVPSLSNLYHFCMQIIKIQDKWKRGISEAHPSRERLTYHFLTTRDI